MEKPAPPADGSPSAHTKLMLPLDFFELPVDGVRQHRLEEAIDRMALDLNEREQTSPILFYRDGLKGVIIGGGTRFLGAKQNGWAKIWAEERPAPKSNFDRKLQDFLDNDMHTPLDPLDEAAFYAEAKEANPGLSLRQLAKLLKNTSATKISRRLAMFNGATPQAMKALTNRNLVVDSVQLLAKLSPELQQVVVDEAVKLGHLKHRVVVRMIKELKPSRGRPTKKVDVEYKGVRLILDKPDDEGTILALRHLTRAAMKAKRKNRPLKDLSDFLRDDDGPKAA